MKARPLTEDDERHGTDNGYKNLGCRCQSCRDAWAKYHRKYVDAHRARASAAGCGTPGCDRAADRAYVTGYCHRCGVARGLKPDPSRR